MNYNEVFDKRTKVLAIKIIKLYSTIPFSDAVSIIRKQIIRSVTSVAANYRAIRRARSEKERYAKLSIVIEEADETLFWLELTKDLSWLPNDSIDDILKETEEIVKATSSYRKKLSQN